MSGKSAILNLFTCLTLAATGLCVVVVALFLVVPGLVPGFMRVPTQPVAVSFVTAAPTETPQFAYPTLPPEWTATPSPQPSPTVAATDTPTVSPVPSDTSTPRIRVASITPVPSATQARTVQIMKLGNVRSGPSPAYPVVQQLSAAQSAPVIGRDSNSQWFAISFAGAPGGTGWVSTLVATYSGNINDLSIVQPSAPPPATAIPATAVPAPTNTPGVGGANGIQTLQFSLEETTGHPYDNIWFDFQVVNNSGSTINYGILAAHTDQGVTADSWHDPLVPGKVLKWKDHINFPNTGTYQVYLGICYDKHDPCKGGASGWTRLSNSITVTIN